MLTLTRNLTLSCLGVVAVLMFALAVVDLVR